MSQNLNAYEDSSEFQADMDGLLQMMQDSELIANKPEFEEWMSATDKHFNNVRTRDILLRLKVELETAHNTTKELWDEILKAE